MAGKKDKYDNFRLGLDTVAVILSIAALIVSLQSNRLARQEYDANVVVLSMDSRGSPTVWPSSTEDTLGTFDYLLCAHTINMVNLGGVEASIIEYYPSIYFRDDQHQITVLENATIDISPTVRVFETKLVSSETYKTFEEKSLDIEKKLANNEHLEFQSLPRIEGGEISFPIKIGSKNTYELVGLITFELPQGTSPMINIGLAPDTFPIDVDFNFKLNSGEILTTPKSNCLYSKG